MNAKRLSPLAGILFSVLSVSIAHAGPGDPQRGSAAQALFDQAIEEMKRKDYAAACPKLEEVTRILPEAVGAKVALAECYEHSNRTASAWMQWVQVEVVASRVGQRDRQTKAAARAEALRNKLAHLTVEVAPETARQEGLVVERDSFEIGKAQWGTSIPVDAGEHVVTASSPGHVTFTKSVRIAADGASVTVRVPRLEDDPSASAPPPTTKEQPAIATDKRSSWADWHEPVAIGATVVGSVVLAAGAVAGVVAITKKNSSDDACDERNVCTDEGLRLQRQGMDFATGSNIGFIVGGVLTATGIVLWLTAPKSEAPATSARIEKVTFGAGSALLQGRF